MKNLLPNWGQLGLFFACLLLGLPALQAQSSNIYDFEDMVPAATFAEMVELAENTPFENPMFMVKVSATPDNLQGGGSTNKSLALEVDCSLIVDADLTCRADLPPVDFALPMSTSTSDVTLSALTIIPGNSGCPGDEVSISRTYFVQNTEGDMDQCAQTFTVLSEGAPTITCPADGTIECGEDPAVNAADAIVTVDCGTPTVSVAGPVIDGDPTVAGTTYTYTYTVTDFCGRMASCEQVFTVVDDTPPVIDCATVFPDIQISCRSDLPAVDFSLVTDNVTDNCTADFENGNGSVSALTIIPGNSGCPLDTVKITRQYFINDGNGNTTECFINIDVVSDVAPLIFPPADSLIDCGVTPVVMPNDAMATFDCLSYAGASNGVTVTGPVFNGEPNVAGTTLTYTFTATDGCGRMASADQVFTVQDTIAPTAVCMDITVQLDDAGMVALEGTPDASEVDGGSSDDCDSDLTFSESVSAFTCDNIGENLVTLTVTDASGNMAICDATVTVEDMIAPVLTCADALGTVENGSFETGDFTGWTAIDNPAPFVPWAVGASSTTGEDFFAAAAPTDGGFLASNGFDGGVGEAILYQVVNVPTAGMLSWDENVDYNLTFGATMTRIHMVEVQDLAGTTLEVLHEVMAMPDVIDTDNVWESFTADLSAYAGQQVRIAFKQTIPEDFTGPAKFAVDNVALVGTGLEVFLDDNGTFDLNEILDQFTATDNCGVATTSLDPDMLTCDDVGEVEVTFSATDVNGLTSDLACTVSVSDLVPPVITVTPQTVVLSDDDGTATLTVADLASATDACGVESLEASQLLFTCEDIGEVEVIITATDVNGNVSTAPVTVTVEFNQPELACIGEINLTLNDECQALVIPRMLLVGNIACIDVFNWDIVVQDDDPSNGPIVDGCGSFTYSIRPASNG
ncbi:MAG: hypothetical protein AB8H12_16855, partial [Lewinella sp.]